MTRTSLLLLPLLLFAACVPATTTATTPRYFATPQELLDAIAATSATIRPTNFNTPFEVEERSDSSITLRSEDAPGLQLFDTQPDTVLTFTVRATGSTTELTHTRQGRGANDALGQIIGVLDTRFRRVQE